ncbi:histidine phosphatase family protein [Rhodococcus sp. BP-252]|uniref:histidine phosphatase family protein n=1 Tax=unclassified Rhodococcus (in: high G+C Gram-positive bacteria) TaxID=192944 RepID=UPI001C9B1105|nr:MULTISPECIES: histidine phosphatase family protein [unclassified Rhodococcus (in: high G+C Gram-positive bacteria)]MBY6414658.1 histidine phosphatase family protein [Rhodococcus sp. BP-320]MBY6419483.1 histidine phosphatase family protein [Rhodococcus sp. BP-321]MBY6424505.1 histidine phosphatase family protein [Rhodococcus sp. BP-324]MBY6429494.1 histidine phosphatase family protein [Rhodococcus sp. BP-323]MBY6434515.1 histidine phosphatase family protein [Rhodococcus sp. BP-322]
MIHRDLQAPFTLPAGAKEIILVRHGSSSATTDGVFLDGHADPHLSSLGITQAAAVAHRLRTLDPTRTALFVTSLRRTAQTAEPAAAALGITPTVIAELREVCLGDYEGSEFEERRRAKDPLLAQVFAEERWDLIRGAEGTDAFRARVRCGLDTIVDTVPVGTTAVAFVHGGVVAEICRSITRSSPFAFVDVENGSLTRIVHHADHTFRLRTFNDTSHLAAADKTAQQSQPSHPRATATNAP